MTASHDTNGQSGPLAGIRVLDLATGYCEIAGRLLADMGAEVIKIEPPGGHSSRRHAPFVEGREGEPDGSLHWAAYGLGKRSVTLDLGDEADRARLRDLARGADALIESLEPGALGGDGARLRRPQRREPRARLRVDHAVRADRAARAPPGDRPDAASGGRARLAARRRRPAAGARRLPAGRAARGRAGRRRHRRRAQRARPLRPRPAPRHVDAGVRGVDADGHDRLPAQRGRRQARLRRRPRRTCRRAASPASSCPRC